MPDPFLSIAIIARDEERHIGAALESAAPVADELIVLLDPRTTDRTSVIARQHGASVYDHLFVSFPNQRNHVLQLCKGTWVLFLDADERLTEELIGELRALRTHPTPEPRLITTDPVGYWMPRHNLYFGKRLKGGGWYPDRQLRLLKRDSTRYDESRLVHELVQLDGATGELSGHLLHINIESWRELHEKQRRYAIAEAQTLARNGERAKWRNLVLQPLREIKRRFWTWHGYRDGSLGLMLAVTMGYYELVKYVHLKALELAIRP